MNKCCKNPLLEYIRHFDTDETGQKICAGVKKMCYHCGKSTPEVKSEELADKEFDKLLGNGYEQGVLI